MSDVEKAKQYYERNVIEEFNDFCKEYLTEVSPPCNFIKAFSKEKKKLGFSYAEFGSSYTYGGSGGQAFILKQPVEHIKLNNIEAAEHVFRTYISLGDVNRVIKFGNDSKKELAKQLIDYFKDQLNEKLGDHKYTVGLFYGTFELPGFEGQYCRLLDNVNAVEIRFYANLGKVEK